jgi:hypothetical protein
MLVHNNIPSGIVLPDRLEDGFTDLIVKDNLLIRWPLHTNQLAQGKKDLCKIELVRHRLCRPTGHEKASWTRMPSIVSVMLALTTPITAVIFSPGGQSPQQINNRQI